MLDVDYVVWDFDGVLNANIVDGRFIWADHFERDLGQSLDVFCQAIFNEEFASVIRGERDLLEHVSAWSQAVGCAHAPEHVLRYWFQADHRTDPTMLALLQRVTKAGVGNVIATNNERHRAAYIEHEMGFAERVQKVYASGRLRYAKPERAFFQHVGNDLGAAPARLLLIDDNEDNVRVARALGWHAHHFVPFDYAGLEARLGLPKETGTDGRGPV